jgi:hypothetical protein
VSTDFIESYLARKEPKGQAKKDRIFSPVERVHKINYLRGGWTIESLWSNQCECHCPDGPPVCFVRIRHYGLLANRNRSQKIARCRELLSAAEPEESANETIAEKVPCGSPVSTSRAAPHATKAA